MSFSKFPGNMPSQIELIIHEGAMDILKPTITADLSKMEYVELQQLAKDYGVKANLSKDKLIEVLTMIKKGEGNKINMSVIKKDKQGSFTDTIRNHKKKIGGGTVALIIFLIALFIILSN